MELGVAVVLVVGLGFTAVIGLAAFRQWAGAASASANFAYRLQLDQTVRDLSARLQTAETAAGNWKTRFNRLQRTGDLDLEDEDWDYDPERKEESIADLVKIIWPKMPKTVGNLIDKPELQDLLARKFEENPQLISGLIDRFFGGKKDTSNPPADTSVPAGPVVVSY